jgi:N-methylhydantoinase B
VMAGGGGWGDPLDRDPEAVRQDVWNEKLTIPYAREQYGVVIVTDSLAVDYADTERLRRQLRRSARS